jgi:hypothetical protein
MNQWKTLGHNFVIAALDRYLERGTMPHALLFFGPEGVGKRTVAEELAQKLLSVSRLDNHPDVHLLDAAADDFDINAARLFMNSLVVKPFSGPHTVGIIDNAEALNPQTANALLKTLEEPNPGTVLILICSGSLLPTIVSRCQVFNFYPLGGEEFSRYISSSGLKTEPWMQAMSAGTPGQLHRLATSPDYAARVREAAGIFSDLAGSGIAQRLAAVPQLAELDDSVLNAGLLAFIHQTRKELEERPERYRTLAAILQTLRSLQLNLNKKMVLERLCLEL